MFLGLTYKDSNVDQSKLKANQNARSSVKRLSESQSTPTPPAVLPTNNFQKLDGDNSQSTQNQTCRLKAPPSKKAHTDFSESPSNPPTTDSDDHFVSIATKIESEEETDNAEDRFANNGPEWTAQVLIPFFIGIYDI